MREIKFRVWDTKSESMEYEIAIGKGYGEDSYILFLGLGETFIIDDDIVKIMQYTGLKDKNNVEIFEGDIIRSHNSRQGEKIEDYEVIYAGSGFCIKSLKENEIHSKGTLYSFALYSDNIDFLKDDYIIGNIHENQELLEV